MLIAALCILPAGLILLVYGLRGRRVDDHPLCRKCGYDLTGKPATSTVCSECGADVTRAKAIRVGHRAKRRAAIKLGVLAILVATVGPGVLLGLHMRERKLIEVTPLWWILRQTGSAGAPDRAAAMKEIFRRRSASELSDADLRSVVDRMLQWQGDPRRPWDPAWGDFVEAEIRTGMATGEQKARYTSQAIQAAVQLRARVKVRAGAALPLAFSSSPVPSPWRMGVSNQWNHGVCRVSGIKIDGKPVTVPDTIVRLGLGRGINAPVVVAGGTCVVDAQTMATLSLSPGTHTVAVELTAEVILQGVGVRSARIPGGEARVSTAVTILRGESVSLIRDPTLQEAEQKAITVSTSVDHPGISHDFVLLNVRDLPVPVMADVVVPAEARTQARWEVIRLPTTGSRSLEGPLSPRNGDGKRDLVLRPNIRAAEETLDLFEIWGEDIVLTVEMAPKQ
ncbi:MAG: hypothetical protein ACHRHE_01440 [Tepidisphaerales bacterium]